MTTTRGFVKNAPTTPLDARLMDLGRVVSDVAGNPRTGILGTLPAGGLLTALGTMNVSVAAAVFAASRTKADGVVVFANDGAVNVAISAAPVSNSRITVIWVKQNDDTQGDANALPVLGTTDGTAAATPLKPAIPTGALELGTLRVYSGTTAANGGLNTLTETYQMTAMQGGVVPFRTKAELDLWTTAAPGQVVIDITTGLLYARVGSAWRSKESVTRVMIPSGVVGGTVAADGTVTPTTGASSLRIDGIFTAEFREYEIRFALSLTADATTTLRLCSGGTPYAGATYGYQQTLLANPSVSTSSTSGATSFSAAGLGAAFIQGIWRFTNPMHSGPKYFQGEVQRVPTLGVGKVAGYVGSVDANSYDGLQFLIAAQTLTGGFLKVYGLV